jgi:hypothetical protein
MSDSTVVHEIRPLDEDEFHASFMLVLARLNKDHTPAKVAHALGYSTKRQLANLANGSLPGLRAYYNLLALDQSAHDELDREYGHRKVPYDAKCFSDPVSAKMATLLARTIEAEMPSSPGGCEVTAHEVRAMASTPEGEAMLREVARKTAHWVVLLEEARK